MDASDAAVQRALVVGDYRGAVAACVAAGRHADALVLAHAGGAELWEETRAAHIAANARARTCASRPRSSRTISAPSSSPVRWPSGARRWRFCARTLPRRIGVPSRAFSPVVSPPRGRRARLHAVPHLRRGRGRRRAALDERALPPGKVSAPAVHSVLEKAVVLTRATGQASGASLSQLVVSYAEMLASRGQLSSAISYLDMVPDGGEGGDDAPRPHRARRRRKAGEQQRPGGVSAPAAPAPAAPAPAVAPAPPTRTADTRPHPPPPTQTSGYGGYDAGAYGGGAYGGGACGQSQSRQPQTSSPYAGAPTLPPAPSQSAYDAYSSARCVRAAGGVGDVGAPAGVPGTGADAPRAGSRVRRAPPPSGYGAPMMPGPPASTSAPPPPPTVAAAASGRSTLGVGAPAAPPSGPRRPPRRPPPSYGARPCVSGHASLRSTGGASWAGSAYGGAPAQAGYGAAPVGGFGQPQAAYGQAPMQPMQPQQAAAAAAPAPPPAPVVPKPPANLSMAIRGHG